MRNCATFVRLIGYSPYGQSIAEFGTIFDPAKVDNQKEKWGFVTRLGQIELSLDDKKISLQLYNKANPADFKRDIKDVDITTDIAPGIGQYSTRNGVDVLIDPMTDEVISKLDSVVNDHWFVLDLKFVLKVFL